MLGLRPELEALPAVVEHEDLWVHELPLAVLPDILWVLADSMLVYFPVWDSVAFFLFLF